MLSIQTINVLFVDDDCDFLTSITESFSDQQNLNVTTSHSVSSALDLLSKKRIDVIVTAYQMSGCTGLDFLRKVKEQYNIPSIILTESYEENVASKALSLDTFYLQKTNDLKIDKIKLDHFIKQAYNRYKMEQKLNLQREIYDAIFYHTPIAFAYHKIILSNQGIPIDYEFIKVNPAFERFTGLTASDIIGKRITAIQPSIRNGNFDWINTYGNVALKQKTTEFEAYSFPLKRWYKVYAFSPVKNYFLVQFFDSTFERCINTISNRFLKSDFQSALNFSLKEIGDALQADQIFFYNVIEDMFTFKTEFQWNEKKVNTPINQNKEDYKNILTENSWLQAFEEGKIFSVNNHPDAIITPKEKNILENLGITSVIFIPIIIKNQFHSLLGIIFSHKREQSFTDEWAFLERVQKLIVNNAEKKQQKHELERWKLAVEAANDGIWDWDSTTNVVFYSKRWKEMIGYDDQEIANEYTEYTSRLHPDDIERTEKQNTRHYEGEIPFSEVEYRMRCKNGSYKWILGRGRIVERNKDGTIMRIVGTHTDISKRKEAEETIIRQRKELNDLVRYMEHDLNNSVAIINFCSENLEQTKNLDDISKYTKLITKQTNYIEKLMDKSISLAEAGNVIGKKQKINLQRIIQECVDITVPPNISIDMPETFPPIYGDPVKLLQVFKNIIENAVVHGKPSFIKITQEMSNNNTCVLNIINDGNIITDKIINLITNKKSRQLGFQIIMKIIEAHEWTLDISNNNNLTKISISIDLSKT